VIAAFWTKPCGEIVALERMERASFRLAVLLVMFHAILVRACK
jgi:hypothetical protein